MQLKSVHTPAACRIVYTNSIQDVRKCMGDRGEYYRDAGGRRKPFAAILIAFATAVLVTTLLLLLLTVLIYNTDISGTVSGILMVVVYVLGPFAGAFVLGKMMQYKRFLWGMLLGLVYFAVFVLVSLLTAEEGATPEIRDYIQVLLAVLPGGILGGMFS